MKRFLKRIPEKQKKNDRIIVVSGLPRSGTSMMMRMIEAGGIPAVTDRIRKPDADNPRGYYEYERVKKIQKDSSWLNDCKNRVIKMVSELLYHLPPQHQYKISFMRRDMAETITAHGSGFLRELLNRSVVGIVRCIIFFFWICVRNHSMVSVRPT